jgi:folate-dependent phosphoribosylglycinamide formyltransferase PurN
VRRIPTARAATPPPKHLEGRVVLLAGPGQGTDIVANFLASRVPELVVIREEPPARRRMAVRRAKKLGWPAVIGQLLFITVAAPILRYKGTGRVDEILRAASVDATPREPDHRVRSINDAEVIGLLTSLRPAMVVVNGTRIIARPVLESASCPVINLHAGITPRYRGVHGGYWALAERHPQWIGSTVHLVDTGIDTGGILAQTVFEVTGQDSFATYPTLHLVHGLHLLGAQVDKVMAGADLGPSLTGLAPGSRLYYHPTLWGYLRRRWREGVR